MLLRSLHVVNVGVRANPHPHLALGIAQGVSAADVPAIHAVVAPEPMLQLK